MSFEINYGTSWRKNDSDLAAGVNTEYLNGEGHLCLDKLQF
jgi:hypothetical protein